MKMTSAGSQYPWDVNIWYQDLPAQADGAEGGGEGRRHGEREEQGKSAEHTPCLWNASLSRCFTIMGCFSGPCGGLRAPTREER